MNQQPPKVSIGSRQGAARIVLATLVLFIVSIGCSVGQAVTGRAPGSPPTATKTPRPTFTSLPGAPTSAGSGELPVRGTLAPGVTSEAPAEAAAAQGTPGAPVVVDAPVGNTNLVFFATNTPQVIPTVPPPNTSTPRPVTPTPAVTPIAVINSDTLNGRRGPGTDYERIGQATRGTELLILGKTADGTWLQVCCMANQPVWVAVEMVTVQVPLDALVVLPPAAPPPAPTARRPTSLLPPPTPIPTRGLPFDIGRGPEFPIKRDDGILTIWVKVYEGPPDNQSALGGYILKVKRDGVDVSNNIESFGDRPFDKTAAREGSYDYNLKFELNKAGEADWEIFLARPGGFQVSPVTRFTTKGDSYRNLVVFIGYFLAR
jgi:hypothetical protein